MLGIYETFQATNKTLNCGIEGYHVEKKYFDPKNQTIPKKSSIKKLQTKKGSYLDDYIHVHGKNPGPGVYDFAIQGSSFSKSTSKKIHYPHKKTIFDEVCQLHKKQKRPGPGHYGPKSIQRPSTASVRRTKVQDRTTFLDEVQYQASTTPGVGAYNPRPQSAKVQRVSRMKPEDWRKKHAEQEKVFRKSASNKKPTPLSYNPVLIGKKQFSKQKKGFTTWGSFDRFKQGKKESMGPGKYMGHEEWGKKIGYCSQSFGGSIYYR